MPKVNRKLVNLLSAFTASEIRDFKKLVVSPLFTTRKNYIPIINEITKNKQKGNTDLSTKELYAKLYPGKPFSMQTMKNRYSELLKLAEEFLVHNHFRKKIMEKEKILLLEFLDKKLFTLFENKHKKTRKLLESMQDNDDKFRNISFLNSVNLSLLNKKSRVKTMYHQYYEHSTYSLKIFLIECFQHGIEFMLQEYDNVKIENNAVTGFLKSLNISALIRNFSTDDSKISKIVCMHYYLYKAFETPDEEKNYFDARKIFNAHNNFFSDEYKNDIYKFMISYSIIRQNSGVKKFRHELFQLYNEKLEQGLYSEFKAKMFPVNTFRDYVFIGLAIKEYEWVENFIKKYSQELPEENREDEINLSFAKLHFANNKYERSLLLLNKVKGTNYLHYCDCAVLKLCCNYELEKDEDSFSLIDKFRHYARNHSEIPKIHLLPFVNFIKIYQKILNAVTQPGKHDLGFLEKEIGSMESVSKREWLIKKVTSKHR